MKQSLAFGFLTVVFVVSAQALPVKMNCRPVDEPQIQGDERFFKVEFATPSKVSLLIASQSAAFEDATGGGAVTNSSISDSAIEAGASWNSGEVTLSLLFAGQGRWKGVVRFNRAERTSRLQIPAGAEYEITCLADL